MRSWTRERGRVDILVVGGGNSGGVGLEYRWIDVLESMIRAGLSQRSKELGIDMNVSAINKNQWMLA